VHTVLVTSSSAAATTVAAAASTTTTTSVTATALLEARRAVDGLVTAGLEWHLRLLAAARAGCCEHLARAAACATTTAVRAIAAAPTAAAIAFGLSGGAAIRATARFRVAAGGIKILLTAGKNESLTAIAASQVRIGRHR
jgi:hypothetical protein